MPAAINITENEQFWIKEYLQETYHTEINDAYDCQNLSTIIEKSKGIKISYSTFRRLFNLVPNANKQSRFVLNALSVAVGFKNWEAFKLYVSHFDTSAINQNIQIYACQLPNSRQLILETIKKLPITTWMGSYQLQIIIALAVENNDFELLKEVIILPFEIEKQSVYEHLVIGFQSLYFKSINNNESVIEFVRTNIAGSILLQKCLLIAYSDEKYLNSFLGKWFDMLDDSKIPDLLLFKNLFMLQKAFINGGGVKTIKNKLSLIRKKISKISSEIPANLKARIAVWELILNKNNKQFICYFNELNNPFDKADFAVIASRLLWTYNNENAPIPFLELISLKEFPPFKDFFQKGRYNILILTFAIHYYLKSDLAKSREYFNLYSPTTLGYDIINVEFYEKWIQKLKEKL